MRIPVPVTLLYAGLNALLITVLGIQVSRLRGATATGLGAALPDALVRPVRAHANAIEWVPLGLVLLLALELSGAGTRFTLHLAGGTLLLARVLHAVGVYRRNSLSVAGAGLTYLVMLVMAVWAVVARFVLFGP